MWLSIIWIPFWPLLLICDPYVTVCDLYSCMWSVCGLYVTRMQPVCDPYVTCMWLVCDLYVTRMWPYVTRMWPVCDPFSPRMTGWDLITIARVKNARDTMFFMKSKHAPSINDMVRSFLRYADCICHGLLGILTMYFPNVKVPKGVEI